MYQNDMFDGGLKNKPTSKEQRQVTIVSVGLVILFVICALINEILNHWT